MEIFSDLTDCTKHINNADKHQWDMHGYHVGLRVAAAAAQDKLLDEAIKQVLQAPRIVVSVDNVSVVGFHVRGRTKLAAKVLDGICR